MKTRFNDGKIYEKIGKRYKPIRDIHALDGLSKGHWLVRVDDNCTSIRKAVNPDNSAIEHAVLNATDKVVKILAKASEARFGHKSESVPLTDREQKAIKAYYDVMGEEKTLYFNYPSMYDIAEKIVKELTNQKL